MLLFSSIRLAERDLIKTQSSAAMCFKFRCGLCFGALGGGNLKGAPLCNSNQLGADLYA